MIKFGRHFVAYSWTIVFKPKHLNNKVFQTWDKIIKEIKPHVATTWDGRKSQMEYLGSNIQINKSENQQCFTCTDGHSHVHTCPILCRNNMIRDLLCILNFCGLHVHSCCFSYFKYILSWKCVHYTYENTTLFISFQMYWKKSHVIVISCKKL